MRIHPAFALTLAIAACAGVGYAGARFANDGAQGRIPNHPRPVVPDMPLAEQQAIAHASGIHLPPQPKSLTLDAARPTSPVFTTSLNCVGVDMPAPSTNLILLRANTDDCAWVWMQSEDSSKHHRVTFKVAPYEGAAVKLQIVGGTSTTDGYITNQGSGQIHLINHPTVLSIILPPGINNASLNVLKGPAFGYMAITAVYVDEF